jgi:hypothetical protein
MVLHRFRDPNPARPADAAQATQLAAYSRELAREEGIELVFDDDDPPAAAALSPAGGGGGGAGEASAAGRLKGMAAEAEGRLKSAVFGDHARRGPPGSERLKDPAREEDDD